MPGLLAWVGADTSSPQLLSPPLAPGRYCEGSLSMPGLLAWVGADTSSPPLGLREADVGGV
jgi:hypothetical protein